VVLLHGKQSNGEAERDIGRVSSSRKGENKNLERKTLRFWLTWAGKERKRPGGREEIQ
jgi:hypothetical protein